MVACLLALSALFCVISNWSVYAVSARHRDLSLEVSSDKIVIDVSGAVLCPGKYETVPGASVKEILDRAGVLLTADKSSIYVKKILLDSCELRVNEKKSPKRRRGLDKNRP